MFTRTKRDRLGKFISWSSIIDRSHKNGINKGTLWGSVITFVATIVVKKVKAIMDESVLPNKTRDQIIERKRVMRIRRMLRQ